jgi:1-pyrroline-5-carboxylate dehydrogenase
MSGGIFRLPDIINEPNLMYAPGSAERKDLKSKLSEMGKSPIEIPLRIGGKDVCTGKLGESRSPHNHSRLLAKFHQAGADEVNQAVRAAMSVRKEWAAMPWEDRGAIFLRAAEMLATEWRSTLNGATMLGQSKNVFQAEIDSACELIDFWRFNVKFMQEIYQQQPISSRGIWNRVEHRGLEGFVFAVTPFNFTAIAGNLPTAPALMGNVVLWKPASSAVFSAHYIMQILEKAGLPPGVINMIPGSGGQVGNPVLESSDFAGIHFTGSTGVFQDMWRKIGGNIAKYKTYPRIVGETGGKDFVFAHPSADPEILAVALVRGAFEYQGQKCSAASRAYIPESLWPQVKSRMESMISEIKMGDVEDFTTFMGAVIDEKAFESIKAYIDFAKNAPDAQVIMGGKCDKTIGYFIQPTVIQTSNPHFKTMEEEIFGPVLTVHVYPDARLEDTIKACDSTSPYALTGAIFATDRSEISRLTRALQEAAGNFYINDKPTGAVVGQQPFGGARASGTNDKAGSLINLQRWVSQRTIKETFVAPRRYEYPHMTEK